MAVPLHPSLGVTLGIGAFIAWRMISRVRRLVGRQRLSRVRPWVTVVVFPLLVAMLALVALRTPAALAGLAAGCAAGVGLGFRGLRLTRFEATPQGLFYTPHPAIGIVLSLLLLARIGWRVVQIYAGDAVMSPMAADYGRSPLTLLVFGMLAGYYATYAVGLLRWKAASAAVVPGPLLERNG